MPSSDRPIGTSVICFNRTKDKTDNPSDSHKSEVDVCHVMHSEVTVTVSGDGRCFLRCLAAVLFPSLACAERCKSGKIRSFDLAAKETAMADLLRKEICNVLREHRDVLHKMSESLQFLLDDTVDRRFLSIDDRISAMSRPTTYVGNVEILAGAYLLSTQIHIFCTSSDGLKLFAKLPQTLYNQSKPVKLLYSEDSKTQPGHFSLLIAETELQHGENESDLKRSLKDLLTILRRPTGQDGCASSFKDVLKDHAGASTLTSIPQQESVEDGATERILTTASNLCRGLSELKNTQCCDVANSRPTVLLSSRNTELPKSDPATCVSSSAMPYCYSNTVDTNQVRNKSAEIKQVGLQAPSTLRHFRRNGRHYVSCTACCKFPDVVKRFSIKGQVPPIALELGVAFRKETVQQHLQQPYHSHSLKALRMTTLSLVEAVKMSDLGKAISRVNEKMADKVGSLFVHAYGDAKKLTLSAFSFPARVVVSNIASAFSWNSSKMVREQDLDFQYLTPAFHKELLQCIVQSHQQILAKKLTTDVLALSIRCDGTVDRTQIDKIYVMAKVITKIGTEEQYFLGASEPCSRGAKGVLEALVEACGKTVGEAAAKHILMNTSSLVTDGASVNTGERSGLWALFRSKIRDHQSPCSVPLLTIWCGVHRSNLAWKSTSNSVSEIDHMFQNLVALATYFHTSGLRSRELREVADLNNSHLLALPKLFEVRWSEFSFALVNSVLVSWLSLVLYMQQTEDKASSGFLAFLLDEDKLILLSFLADVLTVFSRYQKLLQGDGITILDVEKITKSVKARLLALTKDDLPGGWTQAFKKEIVAQSDGVTKTLKGIELTRRKKRRKEHHQYVTDCRDVSAVCTEVVASLVEFLDQRFDVDAELLSTAKSFAILQPSANLERVHTMLCPDLDLSELSLEFWEILEMENIETLRQMTLAQIVRFLASSNSYRNVTMVLARLLAAKPHSADVERLISTSSALKSVGRSSLSVQSENEYLYIYHNMPPLIEWDPRSAVLLWLQKREHRSKDTPKATKQSWFKGIFTVSGSEQAECDDSFGQDNTTTVAKPKAF